MESPERHLQIFAGLVGNRNPSLRFSLHFGHFGQQPRLDSKVMTSLHSASRPHSQMDPWRRVFPEVPKKPFPPAHIQYEPGTELNLKPHPTHPRGATTNVELRVTKLFKTGHGRVSQVLGCFVMNGPLSINGTELVACAYDPLYAFIEDLKEITNHGSNLP